MTATYDISTDVGKVRLKSGDKDLTDIIFTDEEIEVFLANQGNDVNLAAAELLEAWAAEYTASPDSEKIGDYAYTQKIVDKMLKLAQKLKDTASETPVLEWSEPDLTGLTGDDE
ncbi:MAG: hypothetical protein KAR06_04985 [Deltaproteobacteria bacterium]|nr:hypothetical protein [Deltaproteobacteria bacterium]